MRGRNLRKFIESPLEKLLDDAKERKKKNEKTFLI